MPLCPFCKEEIAEGAIYCKHCHKDIVVRKRPIGVTIIAVFILISAAVGLVKGIDPKESSSILFGMIVPYGVMVVYYLAVAIVSIYCGIGLLDLKNKARKICIWMTIILFCNGLFSLGRQLEIMTIDKTFWMALIVATIFIFGINGYILYYLVSRREYFVN